MWDGSKCYWIKRQIELFSENSPLNCCKWTRSPLELNKRWNISCRHTLIPVYYYFFPILNDRIIFLCQLGILRTHLSLYNSLYMYTMYYEDIYFWGQLNLWIAKSTNTHIHCLKGIFVDIYALQLTDKIHEILYNSRTNKEYGFCSINKLRIKVAYHK